MAKPRVFISSTYYDLKHLRSSLENFIESLGFEAVLSEKGDIAYAPDMPLDESCYREAQTADIFVLIIGGRYGSEVSSQNKMPSSSFFGRYDSITKQEYKSAIARDVPTYILVESSVYAEYQTFLKNKGAKNVNYAHVDSSNIFYLIEEILSQPKNNPVFKFDRYAEIEEWLREQWSGLFKELLTRMSSQQQIASLSSKVAELGEINVTLRRYLETIIEKVSPNESERIIKSESNRLIQILAMHELQKNGFVIYLCEDNNFPLRETADAIRKAHSYKHLVKLLKEIPGTEEFTFSKLEILVAMNTQVQKDIDEARAVLGKEPLRKQKSKNAINGDEE